jgi:hypothetical protein
LGRTGRDNPNPNTEVTQLGALLPLMRGDKVGKAFKFVGIHVAWIYRI